MTYKINPVYYLNDADMYKGPINKYKYSINISLKLFDILANVHMIL